METKFKQTRHELQTARKNLDQIDEQLKSVEYKWINNQMAFETYNRWFRGLSDKK